MFKFVSAVLLVAIAIAAYFLLLPKTGLDINQLGIVNDPKPAVSATQIKQEPNTAGTSSNNTTSTMSRVDVEKAQAHVASITAPPQTPIAIKTADHFVTADQILTLPPQATVNVAIENISNSSDKANLEPLTDENTNNAKSFALTLPTFKKLTDKPSDDSINSPLDVDTTNNTRQSTHKLLGTVTAPIPATTSTTSTGDTDGANSTPVNLSRPVFVTSNIVQDASSNTEQSNSVISSIKNNIEKLADVSISQLLVDDKPATTTDTSANDTDTNHSANANQAAAKIDKSVNNNIKLRELLSDTLDSKKRIFYLHAVNPTDEQGIWGIIQKGLMSTFAKGIDLEQGNGTLKTFIPNDADELLSSKKSSFLGKLLSDKVLTTYVYNYEKGNIGKNPDVIKPGQQLIIVTFSEEELLNVYQHFNQSGAKL
ncbi:hypothetical protein WN093_15460 [Gammaproteobacteria bacterium AS21]